MLSLNLLPVETFSPPIITMPNHFKLARYIWHLHAFAHISTCVVVFCFSTALHSFSLLHLDCHAKTYLVSFHVDSPCLVTGACRPQPCSLSALYIFIAEFS